MSETSAVPVIEEKRRAVFGGVIQHFSVTKLQRFNVNEEGCELRWFYSDVQGRKEPTRAWHETGDSVDTQVEHYLATGENVLGRIALVGQHLLPAPGKDLLLQWGLDDRQRPRDENGKPKSYYPPETSKVTVAGIPFIGFADCINGREEYLVPTDEYGERVELRKEPGVVEVIDVKTAKSLRYAKKHEELFNTTQMNGYGEFISQVVPEATHVRLSHNTFTTEAPFKAVKRSVLVAVSEVRSRWRTVVEGVAQRAKVVAAAKNEREVEGNLEACGKFGGCPSRDFCWKLKSTNAITRLKMGLLKGRQSAANGAAAPAAQPNGAVAQQPPVPQVFMQPQFQSPPPPQPQQQYQAPPQAPPQPPAQAIAPQPTPTEPQPPPGFIWAKDALQGQSYYVNGVVGLYLCSSEGTQRFLPQGGGTPMAVPYMTPIVHAPGVVVQQPQVVREPAAPPPPAPLQAQVAPAAAPQMVAPSFAPGAPAAPSFAPGQIAPAPQAEPQKRTRRTKAEMEAARASTGAPAGATATGGFKLCINTIPNEPFTDLAGYVAEAAEELQAQFGVIDIRLGANDSQLAFGKWKGMLAQVAKQDPPPPGTYVAFTRGNELTEVVAEALAPLASGPGQLQRGV